MKRTLTEVSKAYDLPYPLGTSKIEVGYIPHYEKHLPETVNKLVEIGVWKGEGLRMFREYYDNQGQFFAWDYKFSTPESDNGTANRQQLSDEGFITYEAGQADEDFLSTLTEQFDVIVEDGSHHSDEQVITFKHLFLNNLTYGGLYVLEDLHCCKEEYWWRGKCNGYENTAFAIFNRFLQGGNLISQYISEQENEQLINGIDKMFIYGEEDNQGIIAFIYKK